MVVVPPPSGSLVFYAHPWDFRVNDMCVRVCVRVCVCVSASVCSVSAQLGDSSDYAELPMATVSVEDNPNESKAKCGATAYAVLTNQPLIWRSSQQ